MFEYGVEATQQVHTRMTSDLAKASPNDLMEAVTVIGTMKRLVEGILAAASKRADHLHEQGSGDPAEDILRNKGRSSGRQARKQAARTKTAKALPKVGETLDDGSANTENIDTLTNALNGLTPAEVDELKKHDEDLANKAKTEPPENFRKTVRKKITDIRKDAGQTIFDQQKANSRASTGKQSDTGMFYLSALFDPERGASIQQAINSKTRAIARRDGTKDEPLEITDNLRAQALYELIMDGTKFHDMNLAANRPRTSHPSSRNSHSSPGSGNRTSHTVSRIPCITLINDMRTYRYGPHDNSVSETWSGVPLPPQSLARLACDANIHEVVLGLDGLPLNVGRDYRSVTDAQRRALRALYDSCPLSGIDFTDCEIHHIKYWENGGPTDLNNLIPISRRWHHLVHDDGWTLTMNSDRSLILRRPDKTIYKRIPPPESLIKPLLKTGQLDSGQSMATT